MPLVTRDGFQPVEPIVFLPAGEMPLGGAAVDLPNDADPRELISYLGDLQLIRIPFPKSDDGRGFSLAKRLRDLGYRGRLRAKGHVISDQFRYALDCGFDEVEIDDDQAARQPAAHWSVPAGEKSYRDKLSRRRTADYPAPAGVFLQTVTDVEHFTDRLLRFRITRPPSFRFRSGEFVMIGLPNAEKPVFRAYSVASPAWDDMLEFYSIKVPDGPLTEHLQHLRPGDSVLMRRKATGTLVLDALLPGQRLWLFATGTGIAPFASLVRDPETYEKFGQVVLVHTCRTAAELKYGKDLMRRTTADPLVGAAARRKLVHYSSTTREPGARTGRITSLIGDGTIFDDLGVQPLSPATDRVMICGSRAMLGEVSALCKGAGLVEGSNSRPGEFVVERSFVD